MIPALLPTYAQYPITLTQGRGSRVRGSDGREYWDLWGGHAVTVIGHCHPAVTRAIQTQAEQLLFYSNVVSLDVRTRAAERLCEFAPRGLEHVFFCNSGAEANENALKLALKLSGRRSVGAVRGGWHGRSLLTLSATTDDKLTRPIESLLVPSVKLRPNVVADVERIDETIAAVLLEPIQSMAGVVEMTAEFLQALRARCDEVGALLIYDEIQTGMGRLGRPFAAEEHGVLPDMITLAKGIASGVPMGAVIMTPALAARVKSGDLGTTFGGGPLACAALLATVEAIEQERLCLAAAAFGEAARRMLACGPVKRVLGRGCLLGLEVEGDAKPLQQELLKRGFLTGTSIDPAVLRLLPPINTPHEALQELNAALLEIHEGAHAAVA